MTRNYRGANNCTFCNAAKTRTITKTKGQRVDRTNFCEECFDEMQDFNARWAAKGDQERLASHPAMGLTEISRRVQK